MQSSLKKDQQSTLIIISNFLNITTLNNKYKLNIKSICNMEVQFTLKLANLYKIKQTNFDFYFIKSKTQKFIDWEGIWY